jgi:hypothetical protein
LNSKFVPLDLAPPDPRSLAEPVDIVPKLPSSLKTGLASAKWKERKEVLDELLTLVNTNPRIKDAPEFGELARSLATCIQKDANINCVMVAAGCMEGLAKGLMAPFGRYRESVVGPLLERLKERKVNVTDSIGAALDAVFFTASLLARIVIDMSDALSWLLTSRPLYPTLSQISSQPLSIKTLKSKKGHSNISTDVFQHPQRLSHLPNSSL